MLRRKPTAVAVTAEDIAAFEEAHAQRIAYLKFRRTGEDPLGLFTAQASQSRKTDGDDASRGGGNVGGVGTDPSDELKPLPGDRARIVRGREERIMGPAGHRAGSEASGGAGATTGAAGGRR